MPCPDAMRWNSYVKISTAFSFPHLTASFIWLSVRRRREASPSSYPSGESVITEGCQLPCVHQLVHLRFDGQSFFVFGRSAVIVDYQPAAIRQLWSVAV